MVCRERRRVFDHGYRLRDMSLFPLLESGGLKMFIDLVRAKHVGRRRLVSDRVKRDFLAKSESSSSSVSAAEIQYTNKEPTINKRIERGGGA